MLFWCWSSVYDAGPTSNQHWFNCSLVFATIIQYITENKWILFFTTLCLCVLQSDYGAPGSPGGASLASPLPSRARDDLTTSPIPSRARDCELSAMGLSKSMRLLHRTLSEDVKHKRRDSMPATPMGRASSHICKYRSLSICVLSDLK